MRDGRFIEVARGFVQQVTRAVELERTFSAYGFRCALGFRRIPTLAGGLYYAVGFDLQHNDPYSRA